MDPVQMRSFLQKITRVASVIATFTPNKTDDAVVAFFQAALDNDDVMALLAAIIDMFDKKKMTVEEVIGHLQHPQNSSSFPSVKELVKHLQNINPV